MATVNFSVPEDVKEAFNDTFEGRNKSAIVAELMRDAVERARRLKAQAEAFDEIARIRATLKPVSDAEIRRLRKELRR